MAKRVRNYDPGVTARKYVARGDCRQCGKARAPDSKTMCRTCLDKANARSTKSNRRRKEQAHYILGGKCACCGESRPYFLTIDHINNDGHSDLSACGRRRKGSLLYARVLAGDFADLQLLCWNCNCAKNYNNGICPCSEDY